MTTNKSKLGLVTMLVTVLAIALSLIGQAPPPAVTPAQAARVLNHAFSAGAIQNNWTGDVGMAFTPKENITVLRLGVYKWAGDTSTRILKIVKQDGTVLAGPVSVNLSAANYKTGQYAWADITAPPTLTANVSVRLVTSVSTGTTPFCSQSSTVVSAQNIQIDGSVLSNDTAVYNSDANGAHSYGPVNMQFTSTTFAGVQDDLVADYFQGFMHWNIETYDGHDIPSFVPALNVFNPPDGFKVDQWLDAQKAAGVRRVWLTVKHHSGFLLWVTSAPDNSYSLKRTTWYQRNQRDICKEFCDGARARGMIPCFYFSVIDRTYEAVNSVTPPFDAGNIGPYITFVQAQLTELMTNYGPIGGIWFDQWTQTVNHWGDDPLTVLPYSALGGFVKGLQPNCMVISDVPTSATPTPSVCDTGYNTGVTTMINQGSDEGINPPVSGTRPPSHNLWRVSTYWFAGDGGTTTKDITYLLSGGAYTLTRNGAFCLNASPDQAAVIPSTFIVKMKTLSRLLARVKDPSQNMAFSGSVTVTASSELNSTDWSKNNVLRGRAYVAGTGSLASEQLFWHSAGDPDNTPWIKLDFGAKKKMGVVLVWNRQDLNTQGRLRDVTIQLLDAADTVIATSGPLNVDNIPITSNVADYTTGPLLVGWDFGNVFASKVKISRAADALDTGHANSHLNIQAIEVYPGAGEFGISGGASAGSNSAFGYVGSQK
jgi:alpha-L-fucosidase